MSTDDIRNIIEAGKARLGIEFGSTRIKGVLIDPAGNPIAQGDHEWENQLVDGIWTYSMDAVWAGLQDAYADLVRNLGQPIQTLGAIGVFAIKEMGRFYRHVLIEKRFPHHGAVAFGHHGKALFEVFKFLGVGDISYNQPKSLPYPTENPFA